MAASCSGVKDDGGMSFSYQNLSLFFRLANCKAITHANVGPITAPEAAFSIEPPIMSSNSSGFLKC